MTFKERMAYAREHNKQPSSVATTTTKTAMTEFEYCKSIVDLAIAKLKERSATHDN